MRKRPLQDVVTPSDRPRRPIRQYQPPSESTRESPRSPRRGPRFSLWIVAGISIIILGFALSLLFSGARVSVFPKQQEVFVDGNFVAFKDALPGELSFEIMTLEQEGSQSVEASGEETVEERASGVITVYNDYNQIDQRLIKNTRFEAPDGRVYRIRDSIVVPGQEVVSGESLPGSIEVTVYADEPGEEYNAPLMDFTIPGFKGAPQFDHFYARSKTPMTGGFVGTRLTVREEDEVQTRNDIRTELKEAVAAKAFSERPEGFHLFDGTLFTLFEELPREESAGDSVTIREKATLYGVLFEESNLAGFIAANTIAGLEGEEVRLLDVSSLEVTVTEDAASRPWEEESIPVAIAGTLGIVWVFDENSLRSDLEGKSKDALPTILSGYPGIQSIEASLWPFWSGSFPEDGEKIRIEEVLDRVDG